MKRIDWIDSTRYIAIFHVVFIHTIAKYLPELLDYWVTPPSSYIPFLLNAKVAVLFFCVLLGFFAAKPRAFSLSAFFTYALRRYIQFAFFLFISSVVYVFGSYAVTWIFHRPDEFAFRVICDGLKFNIIYILRDAFLFEANYNPTMWSMQQFYIASVLCYLSGCVSYRLPLRVSAVIYAVLVGLLLATGSEYLSWVAFCVMGAFVRLYAENRGCFGFMPKPPVRVSLVLFAWFLYKFPMRECTFVFFLMAVASVVLIIVLFESERMQQLLARPPLPRLGKLAFGVYVVHTPLNSLIHSSLYPLIAAILPSGAAMLLCFALCIVSATLCAYLLDSAYSRLTSSRSRLMV